MSLGVKRIYEPPSPGDGSRILVDRLWPRGISKEKAQLDEWMRELAPSDDLRHWYGHVAERWPEFQKRYAKELEQDPAAEAVRRLISLAKRKHVTLLFSSREEELNNAVALRAYLQPKLGRSSGAAKKHR